MSMIISFSNGAADEGPVTLTLTGGSATFALGRSEGLTVNGNFALGSLLFCQTELVLDVTVGRPLNGSLSFDVVPAQANNPPVILLQNLTGGFATVIYSTASGPATQLLTNGSEQTLTGFLAG